MRRIMSFLTGAIMGGLVGTTLALLLTPTSGEELRARIQERTKQIQAEVRSAAETRRNELESQLTALQAPK